VNFYHTYIVATYSTGSVEVLNSGPANPNGTLDQAAINDFLGNNQQQIYGKLIITDSETLPLDVNPDTMVTVFTPNAGSAAANDAAIDVKMQAMKTKAEALGTSQTSGGFETITTNIGYNLFGNNSNAVTNTLLRSVGITPSIPHESPHFLRDSCWPYFAAKS
jgi:hypothetical protein